MPRQPEYVWMIEEGLRAELINLGAHVSVVRYRHKGTVYQVLASNDEFEHIREEGNDED